MGTLGSPMIRIEETDDREYAQELMFDQENGAKDSIKVSLDHCFLSIPFSFVSTGCHHINVLIVT